MLRILSLLALAALSVACAGETADDDSAETADALKNKNKKKDKPKPDDPKVDKTEWQPHMFENFDAWDDARWTKSDDLVPPRTTTCYRAQNVTVADGMLRIAARKESYGGQPHTGGAVHSYGKFWTGKYFRAEVRARVSQEQGIFGAPLWFRPGTAAGAGTVGGEIDVMESLGSWNRPRFQTTLHPDYSDDKPFVFTHKDYSSVNDADGTGFHVYTVEKKKGGITFYVDDQYVGGWGNGHGANEPKPAWFDRWFEQDPAGWSIRIDNKVGGPWAGEPDASTDWGNKTALYIDYIKVFRPAP